MSNGQLSIGLTMHGACHVWQYVIKGNRLQCKDVHLVLFFVRIRHKAFREGYTARFILSAFREGLRYKGGPGFLSSLRSVATDLSRTRQTERG